MCGRYVLRHSAQEIQQRFDVDDFAEALEPRYNIAPTQQMPVIVQRGDKRQMQAMRWGLVPSWMKEPNASLSTFNARAEGIAEKPMYRGPIRRQRCLVPADGFYEWTPSASGSKKQPYFIHLRDNELFAFAGLYDHWRAPDGSDLWSYTIITGEPNAVLAPLHHRMAVILRREDEEEWLDPGITDPFQVMRLLKPYPADDMEAYPVAPLVNNARNDAPEMVAQVGLL
jgi:putative SOS response-associated peptidase YedK